MIRTLALLVLVAGCMGDNFPPRPPSSRATVPLHVEGNRPFVDITFRKPDGSPRVARFLVDTGGGGFLIVEPLAKDLGLPRRKACSRNG